MMTRQLAPAMRIVQEQGPSKVDFITEAHSASGAKPRVIEQECCGSVE